MLKFYDVDSHYTDFLRKYDNQIPFIKYEGKDKFLCGIVLEIDNIAYYAPISSNKIKQRTNLPIYDSHENIISTIRFCFMFPAFDGVLEEKDFALEDQKDSKYTDLLKIEYEFCKKNEEKINEKAKSIYRIGCNKNHPFNYTCCDFKKLESIFLKYI